MSTKRRVVLPRWLLALAIALGGWTVAHAEDPPTKPLELGVFPYLPALELEKIFSMIGTEFAAVTNREVRFRSSSDYDTFAKNLATEQYDVAFIQPFFYVDVAAHKNYTPLAARDEPLTAVIVTNPDDPITTLADLKGKTLTLPPESAAVSVLAKAHLATLGMKEGRDIQYVHTKSLNSCMHQLLIGETQACATAHVALRYFEQKMGRQLRVVAETPGIAHSLFVTHARVSAEQRAALLQRILNWKNTEIGQSIMTAGQFSPFKATVDKDYDQVRALSAQLHKMEKNN